MIQNNKDITINIKNKIFSRKYLHSDTVTLNDLYT